MQWSFFGFLCSSVRMQSNALFISARAQRKQNCIAQEMLVLSFSNISVSELVPDTCTGVCFILTTNEIWVETVIELYLCITQIYS